MGELYRDARLKIKRAEKHIADVNFAVLALENSNVVTVKHENDGRLQTIKYEVPEIKDGLEEIALIAGDAIHNLRSALDFAWRSTISRIIPEKVSDYTKFPVRETSQDVEAALNGIQINSRCKALFDCIMSEIQPYRGSHNSIAWVLHDLDISDKHLLILELNPTSYIDGMVIRDVHGKTLRGTITGFNTDGPMTFRFENDISVQYDGKISVTVTLKQTGIYKPLGIGPLLSIFRDFTLYTVQKLEQISSG